MAAKSDWGGALTVGGFAFATAAYNHGLKQQGKDAAGAALLEILLGGLALGMSPGQGFIPNGAGGVLGGAVASLVFEG